VLKGVRGANVRDRQCVALMLQNEMMMMIVEVVTLMMKIGC